MSGDVQPRKRKDKKKKKDELGIEEPRGTSAVFGEGDVFMHSQHDHGTGGHWCAKIIFFSLLAVLVTLIGLIILENRGLTELEANSVESRYSGVLDGWLEENADDHHDDHTLDLMHHEKEKNHKFKKYVEESSEQPYDNGDEEDVDNNSNNLYHKTRGHEFKSDEIDGDSNDNNYNNLKRDDFKNNLYKTGAQENDNDDNKDELLDKNKKNLYINTVEQENDGDENDDDSNDDDDAIDKYENNLHQSIDSDEINGDNNHNFNEDDFEYNIHKTEEQEKDDDVSDEFDDEYENVMYNKALEQEYGDNENDNNENSLYHKTEAQENDDEENSEVFYNEFYTKNTNNDEENENSNEHQEPEPQYFEDEEDNNDDEEVNDSGVELEKIEREVSDEEPISMELPALPEHDDDEENEKETGNDIIQQEDVSVEEDNDDDFLDRDDEFDTPIVEHITAPAGKPYFEVDEDTSSEKPAPSVPNTLAEEEEYEKRQEELRREEEQASHVWLKLGVGTALLAATHYVMRRAFAPRDVTESSESGNKEKASTAVDRRMTLIPEEPSTPVTPETELPPEYSQVIRTQESQRNEPLISKSILIPSQKQNSEDGEVMEESLNIQNIQTGFDMELDTQDKELFSEDDDDDDDDVDIEEDLFKGRQGINEENIKQSNTPIPNEEEILDDVEIIDEETLEEEMEEEEISDVDDAELLSRLEAKYGRLPEPERPGQKHKDGGNSVEDEWPGDPSDPYWRQQLDKAEEEFRQGAWSACGTRLAGHGLAASGRARWLTAQALDRAAEQRRDNTLLSKAITAYLHLLKMNEQLSDKKLIEVAERTLDRIQFRGTYLSAEPVYRLLIRRFPNDPMYRNKLSICFLMASRADLAEEVIKETLQRWPNDRLALAHYGFILKTEHNRLEEAVEAFQKALEGDTGPANEPRFYYHLGDSLLLLGRYTEAHEVHKRGAALGHFLSPAQRSLYNVPRLKSKPWWSVEDTPYVKLARSLEKSWREILKEGEAARDLYEKEKEGLKERGDWSQLDLFVRGREIANRCKTTPVTCSLVRAEVAASECRRGQVKFSSMAAGTHVRPHVGPTNCRLRMHLGLSNTKDTYIRVDKETRQWTTGKVLLFDDSFEHEVWHNGTGARLVLIVDMWHPDLTAAERRQLPAI